MAIAIITVEGGVANVEHVTEGTEVILIDFDVYEVGDVSAEDVRDKIQQIQDAAIPDLVKQDLIAQIEDRDCL